MRIKRIDLYVLAEVLFPFLGGVVFFTFIFLMFQILRLAEFFIIHGVSGMSLLRLTSLLILSFLPMALPIAFLVGVLIGFGRLSADSELVAMKANGISLSRLSLPVVALATGVVALSLGLNLQWVPRGETAFRDTLAKVSSTKVVSAIKEGTFTSGFFDLLIYADRVDSRTGRLKGVFIYDERQARNPNTIVAREGEILPVKSDSEFGAAAVLKLYNGNIHQSDVSRGSYQKIDFGEYRLFLKIDEGGGGASLKPRMMDYRRLLEDTRKAAGDPPWQRELKAEMARRIAVAMSPLIFVFLGVGFGTVRTRAVRSGAALVALGVIIFYYSTQAFGTVAAQKGWIPPLLALQIPNVVSLLIAMKAFRSASW